jgi:adenylate cyclase
MVIFTQYPPNNRNRFETGATSLLVGRKASGQEVDLDLTPDALVSRHHARLTLENGTEFWIEDLNSKYGTWVNGQNIKLKTRLWPGDKVQLGQTKLEIQMESGGAISEGVVSDTMVVTQAASALILPMGEADGQQLETARTRLTAFYELGAALGTAEALEPLAQTVVEHLLKSIPGAKRGALLLGAELLLKAHLPAGRAAVSTRLAQRAMESRQAFIWRASPSSADMFASVVWAKTQAAMYAPLIWKDEVMGVVCVDTFTDPSAFGEDDLRLITAMANQAAMFVKNQALQQALRQEEALKANLLRQFSPKIAERFIKETGRMRLGGERANPVTILTSDVRGFTSQSAHMEPAEVMQMLNEMFSVCVPIIFKYDGMVDKFIGDSILAVFGSPEPDEKQCEKAVRAAWEMQQALTQLGEEWRRHGLTPFEIGIGIHTGAVLHGFLGAQERMEYTVIGATVNLADRYCSGAARGEILISQSVFERVYRLVDVEFKTVRTKHPETEPDLEGFVLKMVAETAVSGQPSAISSQ